jgi:hypothetical protein
MFVALNSTLKHQAELTAVLKATGTKRMIVGHTPQVLLNTIDSSKFTNILPAMMFVCSAVVAIQHCI